MKNNGSPEPVFETNEARDYFLTLLPIHPEAAKENKTETRGKTRGKIVELMITDPHVTVPCIAELLGLTVKGVEYHIARMKEDSIIQREGGRKEGTWRILPEQP